MKFINEYKESDRVCDIYLCKQKTAAVTKNGKPYETLVLQDKTGVIDAKIWDPGGAGISDFDALDYIEVHGEVNNFQGVLQVNIKRVRRCEKGDYCPADYLPKSRHDIDAMYDELLGFITQLKNTHLQTLMTDIFINDDELAASFKQSSAAKSIHHSFVGGLLEHTLSVVRLCDYLAKSYPFLQRDLLISAALCHDIGKVKEISSFPQNDYTDEGQFIGHIVIGSEMLKEKIVKIPDFPDFLAGALRHCILSHHGEFAFGSPKKPAIVEAVALNFADNTDAKLQIFSEALEKSSEIGWQSYNRLFESKIIATRME
ncbi:MAG: HD domain-containing protein [Lachnospiraceae bacterium]|jgi:3'-5' exoribonuclease|nr:HD domain-containing protein [Lachnospiraceae bacterium]